MIETPPPLAAKIFNSNPNAYQALVVKGATPSSAHQQLAGIGPDQLRASPASSSVTAFASLAGLWLWLDGLKESHEIVQKTPEELHVAALNLHSKSSDLCRDGVLVQAVENFKPLSENNLPELESTLSLWHAIMHRREGDFSNSKYWLARVGKHPVFDRLAGAAPALIHNQPADKSLLKVTINGWNAAAFVDLVQAVHDRPDDPRHALSIELQRLEWRTLFEWCLRG